jgi:hypothetical protein
MTDEDTVSVLGQSSGEAETRSAKADYCQLHDAALPGREAIVPGVRRTIARALARGEAHAVAGAQH